MALEIRIYYKDTDAGGVVYYANYLNYFEVARTEFLRQQGLIIEDYAADGILFMVAEVNLKYVSPAYYGDILSITTEVAELRKASLVLRHRVTAQDNSVLVAEGTTKLVCVNTSAKPIKLPEEFSQKLQ